MFTVEYYVASDGSTPYFDWLVSLPDSKTGARIAARVDRIEDGNFGDHKSIGTGLWELRLDFGPGYRVYYVRTGLTIVVILGGGRKSTQRKDILNARRYAREQEDNDS